MKQPGARVKVKVKARVQGGRERTRISPMPQVENKKTSKKTRTKHVRDEIQKRYLMSQALLWAQRSLQVP
jgi:hypothetical protein